MAKPTLEQIFKPQQTQKPSLDELFGKKTEQPNYLERVGQQYEKAGERVVSGIKKGAEQYRQGAESGNIAQATGGLLRAGLRTVGTVAGTAFAPIMEAPGIKQATEKIAEIPVVQQLASKANELAKKYPEIAKDVEDVVNLATLGVGKTVEKPIASASKNVTKKAIGSVDDLTKGITQKAGEVVKDQPAKIMQRVARITKGKQAKFEKMSGGESVGKYLVNRGIYGNVDEISEQLYKRFEQSKGTADEALSKLKGTFTPDPIKTALKELFERETRVSTPGAPSPILARVTELNNKISREGLTMSEINEAKRLFERNVKVDYLKQNLPESVARANNIDNAIRDWQFSKAEELGLKNLKDINKETRLAKQLLDDLGIEYSGQAGNNAVSLTDWIMLSGGDPTAIAGFLTKKTFSSKDVQSAIAKFLAGKKQIKGEVKAELTTPRNVGNN